MNKKKVSLFITDLDDTLFNWFDQWYNSFEYLLNEIRLRVPQDKLSDAALKAEIRAVHRSAQTSEYSFLLDELPCLLKLYSATEIRENFSETIIEYKRRRRVSLKLYSGVMNTLKSIKSSGCKIVAYTESMEYHTVERMRILELDGVIDHLYSRDDHNSPEHIEKEKLRTGPESNYILFNTIHTKLEISHRKPDVEILDRIISENCVKKSECVYLGDSLLKDIVMANDCGVTSVLIKHPNPKLNDSRYNLLREVTHWSDSEVASEKAVSANPQYCIETFAELLALFDFGQMKDLKPSVIAVWEKTVDVQMHFNDIQLRIRSLYASVLIGIIGATGAVIVTAQNARFEVYGFSIHFVLVGLFAIILSSSLFYMMDRHWYHRFLQGAVSNAIKIETEFQSQLTGISLSKEIGSASKILIKKFSGFYVASFLLRKIDGRRVRSNLEISSNDRLEIFYMCIFKPTYLIFLLVVLFEGITFKSESIFHLLINGLNRIMVCNTG